MADQERPNARKLAGSAVDLNGYAVLLRQWASHADKSGMVAVPAARLVAMSEFFEDVVDELLTLIPPDPVKDAETERAKARAKAGPSPRSPQPG